MLAARIRSDRFTILISLSICLVVGVPVTLAQMYSITNLGTFPEGSTSCANGINDSGQVVGWSQTAEGPSHAFLYSGGVMSDLNNDIGESGLTLDNAYAINDKGQIVGWGMNPSGYLNAFLLTTLPPTVLTPPQTQTAEAGATVELWVRAKGGLPLFCQWCCNGTNLGSCSTNCELQLTAVQFNQSGTYTAVITNVAGAVTSSPARLQVIAPVAWTPAPALNLTGDAGSLLNIQYTHLLGPAKDWLALDSVSLISTSQFYFDVSTPLPPQRFYRVWQMGTPRVLPSLNLTSLVPAITLTGNIGDSLEVDCISQFGPTNAWWTLGTVTLTNTSEFYFDVTAPLQPARLYRIVRMP